MAKRRDYESLQDWMERTHNNQASLLELVNARTTEHFTKEHLSKILSGARRCSIQKALALSLVTGVPVEKLTRWPSVAKEATSEADAVKGAA
jgi:hypothetical protein